jgi:multiple sugar transport system substrate-binding protein
MTRKLFSILSFVILFTLLMTACQPTEVIKTVAVVQTQVVTQIVAGTPQNVIITATTAPTKDTSKDPVNLRFTTWTANETQLKLLNDIAADYKTTHPNVTVKFDSISADDYIQKVSIQLAGGDPPDAGWMLETAAANWIKAGALSDLAPKLNSFPSYDFADLSPKALAFWVRDQAVYGVPFSTSPMFVLYNADMFKAAGVDTPDIMIKNNTWTFENFVKAAAAVQAKLPKGSYAFGSADGTNPYASNIWNLLTPFVRAYGSEFWSDDFTTCTMNSAPTVQAVQLFQNMVLVDHSFPPPGENTAFTAGNIAMTFAQISRVGPLKDAKFKWAIAPLPSGPAGYKPTIGQAAVVAFKASKNQAAAQDFVAFITTKENVAKLAAFWPPARVSVLNTDVIAKNNPNIDPAQIKAAITDSIVAGKVISSHPDFAKVDLAGRPFLDKLWVAGAKVQDQMDAACKALAPYFTK